MSASGWRDYRYELTCRDCGHKWTEHGQEWEPEPAAMPASSLIDAHWPEVDEEAICPSCGADLPDVKRHAKKSPTRDDGQTGGPS